VKDFYYDLQEIVNSQKNLDKKEIYLYFGDIDIEKKKFPLFYIQANIKEYSTESHFKISFSNEMFVNRKAIQYAFQVLFKDDKKVETFDEERKLYISEEENLSERLTGIVENLVSKLRTSGDIDFKNSTKQVSRVKDFIISNNCYFSVFDKSDEALVNDYEDILSKLLAGDSDVAEMFKQLITDFLINEPEVVNENIEDEWDGLEVSDRLNYESPIPVNPEQQKILKALNNEKCKYVVVEGPPGTGKSHTISAIAFDYILKFKSILILSDTREGPRCC
jgi:signal recognition particle GTPase